MQKTSLLIGLTMAVSIANAQGTKKKLVAQNTTASASAVAQSDLQGGTATMSASPATQTSIADAAASKPATAKKFGVALAYETAANVGALKQSGSTALVDAVGAIGLTYKATDKLKTKLQHNFAAPIIGDRAQLGDSAAAGETQPYKTLDPTIHADVSTDISVLGSKPISIGNRYYVPVTQGSVEAGSMGTLRSQTSIDWDLNPKVTVSAFFQGRLYMANGRGTNADEEARDGLSALGSDSRLRLIFQPSLTYNFSDTLNAYYGPYIDMITTGHQRGVFTKADKKNELWQEIGANWTVGSVTINPAWATKGVATGNTYKGMGTDANSEYYMNLYATF